MITQQRADHWTVGAKTAILPVPVNVLGGWFAEATASSRFKMEGAHRRGRRGQWQRTKSTEGNTLNKKSRANKAHAER